jgi:hypothetical protein
MAKVKMISDYFEKSEPPEMVPLQVEVRKELFQEAKILKKVDGYTWTRIVEAGLQAFVDSANARNKKLKTRK